MSDRDQPYFSIWRQHESIRGGFVPAEVIQMARRGELVPGDRVAVGSAVWRPVESIESLQPILGEVWRDPSVSEAVHALGAPDPRVRSLSLAKLRALGLARAPQCTARMLATAARLADEDNAGALNLIEEVGMSGGALKDLASKLADGWQPLEVIQALSDLAASPRMRFDVARCLVADSRFARAAFEWLFDRGGLGFSCDGEWLRDALKSIPPEDLIRTVLRVEAGDSISGSVQLESWLLCRLKSDPGAGESLRTSLEEESEAGDQDALQSRVGLKLNCNGSALSEPECARLARWLDPCCWRGLHLRGCTGGVPWLLNAFLDGLEAWNDEDAWDRSRIWKTEGEGYSGWITLEKCRVADLECDNLSPCPPNAPSSRTERRAIRHITMKDCEGVAGRLLGWLADHAISPKERWDDGQYSSYSRTCGEYERVDEDCSLTIEGPFDGCCLEGIVASNVRKVDISGVRMRALPRAVASGTAFPRLLMLRVNDAGLRDLGEDPLGLPELQVLDLMKNQVESVAGALSHLHALANLNLSDNVIRRMRAEDLPALREGGSIRVNLSQNPLHECPGLFPQLESYDLSETLVEHVPVPADPDWSSFQLEILSLPRTLVALPPGTEKLPRLGHLALNGASLRELPVDLFKADSLEYVDGLNGGVELIQSQGGEGDAEGAESDPAGKAGGELDEETYAQLQGGWLPNALRVEVALAGCDSESDWPGPPVSATKNVAATVEASGQGWLPDWLGGVRPKSLKVEDFGGPALPPWVGSAPLWFLELDRTRLTELPAGIFSRGSELVELSCTSSPWLSALPEHVEVAPAWLRSLLLDETGLRCLPEWIADCKRLEQLSVDNTQVDRLPARLMFTSIELLSISGSPVLALPESAPAAPTLRRLRASGTLLTSLPDWLGQCPRLESINLTGTPIKRLPASLKSCSGLTEFLIDRHAPLDEPSRAVLASLPMGVVKYA